MENIFIYLLFDEHNIPIYVGKSNCVARRLREHKKKLGFSPSHKILEVCGDDWPEVESRWIEHYRALGFVLLNKTTGGDGIQCHSASTRETLSRIGRGRPKPEGFGDKIRAARKGVPQNWSEDGRARVERTQIKPGSTHWESASDETKATWLANLKTQSSEKISADLRRRWATLTPEQRADASAKRASSWANMTPEARERRLSGLRRGSV